MPKAPKKPELNVVLRQRYMIWKKCFNKYSDFNKYFLMYYEAFKRRHSEMIGEEREKLFTKRKA